MDGYNDLNEALAGQNGIEKFKNKLLELKDAFKPVQTEQDKLRQAYKDFTGSTLLNAQNQNNTFNQNGQLAKQINTLKDSMQDVFDGFKLNEANSPFSFLSDNVKKSLQNMQNDLNSFDTSTFKGTNK